MNKKCVFVLKIIMLIFFILILGIIIIIYIGGLQEKPLEHPLDFQDVIDTEIDKPINSVEDGLPYALKCAHKWRQDAVLTDLQIISIGKDEIENIKGRFRYIFQFAYIDESKPSGILIITISTKTNCIEYISASHDREYYTRKFEELELKDYTESIRKVYDVAIKAIGNDNIFKYDEPFVRMYIDFAFTTFELSPSPSEPNKIKSRVKISMKTYDVVR